MMMATKKPKPDEKPSPVTHVHVIRVMPCKGKGTDTSTVEVRAETAEEVMRSAAAVWDCLAASKDYLMLDKRPGSL